MTAAMMRASHDSDEISFRRLEALLEVSRTITKQQMPDELADALVILLHEVVEYDSLGFLLYDSDLDDLSYYYPGSWKRQCSEVRDFSIDDGPARKVLETQSPVISSIEDFDIYYPKLAPLRHQINMNSACMVPLTSMQNRLGCLEFISSKVNAYTPEDVRFIQLVAAQVATSVANALAYARIKASEDNLARERDHLQTLLDVTNAAVSRLDTKELIGDIARQIERVLGAEFCGLVLHDLADNQLRWEVVHFPSGSGLVKAGRLASLSGPVVARALRNRRPCTVSRREMEELSQESDLMVLLRREEIRSFCALPLIVRDVTIGVLTVGQFGRDAFRDEDVQLLGEIAGQVSMSVGNTLAYREIKQLQDRLRSEKLYLEEEIKAQYNFEEIIGESDKLRTVLDQIKMVADSNTSVLILGETGTGKELIARAIHNLSARKSHPLIKVNCAAIPAGLLESDLFGHEKGAFTGATNLKIGRFELAHQGTIFLDEVGEIPLELQAKLLRVLQEHEIERLGSVRPIHVDARIISATNQNLWQMISDRKFRSDLYYRLNVFPIVVPPLRDRPEDIPLLVRHFVKKYANQMKRDIQAIPSETMTTLMRMPWPGNIRELENHIERAVIVSQGHVLQVPSEWPTRVFSANPGESAGGAAVAESTSLEDMERNHILRVLRETKGIVAGSHGAAARLGLKRTTLLSKMQRLGIERTTDYA